MIRFNHILSRDIPMVAVAARDTALEHDIPKFFGVAWPPCISIYRNGTVESWRPANDFLTSLPLRMARALKTPAVEKKFLRILNSFSQISSQIHEFRQAVDDRNVTLEDLLRDECSLFQKSMVANISNLWIGKWDESYFTRTKKHLFSAAVLEKSLAYREKDRSYDEFIECIEYTLQAIAYSRKLSPAAVRLMTMKEILQSRNSRKSFSISKSSEREHGYVYLKGKVTALADLPTILREMKYVLVMEKLTNAAHSITGQCAFKGASKGRVVLVFSKLDAQKVVKGCILVSPMTTPAIVPYMKKAAAFVTDEGGITCHAAILSRELQKPCIIGTKIATKVLKDGDLVEVDAHTGVVTILKRKNKQFKKYE